MDTGRQSIYQKYTPMKQKTFYSAACYCRLSDDDEQDGTSVSIETQEKILEEYCKQNHIAIFDFYRDDGYTGTNFNRPDFKRMMEDAEKKRINVIIVKDLSRFARNYLEIGSYVSDIFPRMNIRFIAISDDIDSERGNLDYDLLFPIKNIFNEYYPADCSKKVKQAFISKASSGEFIGSQAPYGMKKSEKDKHVLEIDEETAPTVQWMFEMAAYHGYGYGKLAKELSAQKKITPAAYQALRSGREYNKDPYDWNHTTLYKLFQNETYLGTLVSGKRRKASFKSNRILKKDREDWIVVENQFPALISERLWEDAHKALDSRKRTSPTGNENIFSGLLKCESCGYALGLANSKDRVNYFVCNNYKRKGPAVCTTHYIQYDTLYELVLKDMQRVLSIVQKNREKFHKMVYTKLNGSDGKKKERIEHTISVLEAKAESLDKRFDLLYEDRINGIISEKKFKDLAARCEEEQNSVSAQIEEQKALLEKRKETEQGMDEFLKMIEPYEEIRELNSEILHRLVEKIVIGERIKTENGYEKNIEIHYRFIGTI